MSRDVASNREPPPASTAAPAPASTIPPASEPGAPIRPGDSPFELLPVPTSVAGGWPAGRSVIELWPIVVAFGVFVVAWKVAAIVAGLGFILPAPEVVAARFVGAWADGTMEPHAWTTLVEVALGFATGASVGLVVGYAIARSRLVERFVSPYLVAAQAVPILALAPLLALWFGPGLLAKVVICGLIVFFPVAIATMVGIRSVDRGLIELAASLRATRRQVLTTIEVPAALPSILGGLRVGATLAVVGAIVGEWAGADKGLGVLVNLARGSLFDYPLMFATLVTIALLGIAAYLLVVLAERRLVGLR
jgi:NitT/TauT family transport system permease protein